MEDKKFGLELQSEGLPLGIKTSPVISLVGGFKQEVR